MTKPVYAVLGLMVLAAAALSAVSGRPVPRADRRERGRQPRVRALQRGIRHRDAQDRPPAADDAQGCSPAEDRGTLVPVPDEPNEPTLAPPEPVQEDSPRRIVVVQVKGELPASDKTRSAIAPIPVPQGEPTLAPPEPPSSAKSPHLIVVQVEAEQAAEEGPPAEQGPVIPPRRRRLLSFRPGVVRSGQIARTFAAPLQSGRDRGSSRLATGIARRPGDPCPPAGPGTVRPAGDGDAGAALGADPGDLGPGYGHDPAVRSHGPAGFGPVLGQPGPGHGDGFGDRRKCAAAGLVFRERGTGVADRCPWPARRWHSSWACSTRPFCSGSFASGRLPGCGWRP